MIIIASIAVLVFIFCGMSVSYSFLAGSLLYMVLSGTSMGSVVPTAFHAIESYALLAIPLYMLAGSLMEISGIAERLINFSSVLLKKFKGGMGASIPLASMFFGTLSGSGTATVAALSNLMLPRLEKMGWDKRYTAALLGASGPLGYMIPPNMNAILYAVIADASVAGLFLATVLPGMAWGLLYILINRFTYQKWYNPDCLNSSQETAAESAAASEAIRPSEEVSYWKEFYSSFKLAIPAFIMPFIILGGIYGGVFTATEAGAVACVYALIAGIFIFKRINLKNGWPAFIQTGETLGSILIILPMVAILTRLLLINGVPQMVAEGLTSLSSNKYVILLMIDILFFIAGFFLDAGVLIFVVTPLLMPTAKLIGMDPIQLGVIMFVAVGVGTVTPPMAMNLFITAKASGVNLKDMIKPLWPFVVFGALPILFLVTYVPEFSLWLPRMVMGN